MKPLDLPAGLAQRAFTTVEARDHGVSKSTLRNANVVSLTRGLHRSSGTELTLAQRAVSLLPLLPAPCVVDATTALRLVGVEVGRADILYFATTARHASERTGLRVRRVKRLPSQAAGIARPLDALVSARHELTLVELVIAGDWLLHLGLVQPGPLRRALAGTTGRHCRRARRAAELVMAGVESPRETRLRLLIVLAGLPVPECNVRLSDGREFIARVDLLLRRWNVVVEYEGDHHRTDAGQFDRDIGRYERLAAAGYLAVRITKVAMRNPVVVLNRIDRALRERGYDGPTPLRTDEWRSIFRSSGDIG